MFLISFLNLAIALGGLVLALVTIILFVDYFLYQGKYLAPIVTKLFWSATIFITASSVVMSLTYSEYFGFIPCSLCWLQRIAIYPQAIMSILAFRLRDTKYFPVYGIGLSVLGLLVAVYQYIYQMLPPTLLESGLVPCLADGSGADCATKVIDLFGFVTLPLISAITFSFLIILYLYTLRSSKDN